MSSSVFSSRRFGCAVFAKPANIPLSPAARARAIVAPWYGYLLRGVLPRLL